MDDITEVSSTASIERKNTFMITKSTEARSKTVFSTIIGLRRLQSRNIAGEVFYPNSNQPEHLSSLKEMWIL